MYLYLIRHADALDPDPLRWPDDRGRPLSPEGASQFRRVAGFLGAVVPGVEVVLRSPYLRAEQTADILSADARWPAAPLDVLEPEGSPAEVVASLAGYRGGQSVALVGHEPLLSSLASYTLVGERARASVKMRKGAALCVEFDPAPAPGGGAIRWLLDPRLMGAMQAPRDRI